MSTPAPPPLLLINLGTPSSPRRREVKKYLDEFLMDPEVITFTGIKNPFLSSILRWLLVKVIITPRRAVKSAESYQKIWTKRGSPLLFHSLDLQKKLQAIWPAPVLLAMRYGEPSVSTALKNLSPESLQQVRVIPLYPQYSTSAWKSAAQNVVDYYRSRGMSAPTFIGPFNRHPDFVAAWEENLRSSLEQFKPDHVLFSYHGLPESHLRALDPCKSHCLKSSNCCDHDPPHRKDCYRRECFWLTERLASRLLRDAQIPYSLSFQSRLGREPWIQPYTDQLLRELPQRGCRRLLVLCPAFVADCLETLEEISLRGRRDFIAAGGQDLQLVASLNSTAPWVNALAKIAQTGENRSHV